MTSLIESVWHDVNRMRRSVYRRGTLKTKRLPKPVISIGNIAAGGAGKTPCVIAVAKFLVARGLRVCVLTRGYGRSGAGREEVHSLDAERYGDEPVLIKKSVPEAIVIVGHKRYENGLNVNCDVYLLDDGFQHLQLHRDLDVVIDVPDARYYREGRDALDDADIVIPRRIRPENLSALRGKKVFAFAGLANNEQFFAMLRENGVELTGTRGFPDHHDYGRIETALIKQSARGADLIVTTEKDAVKLADRDMIPVAIEFDIDDAVLERIAAVAHGSA
ncbi:MAG TPA: tetraacyldisaccharide 4'-kinase [Thermoanaerobaculia bacterium]